jgi:hypothetical protein
MKNNIENSKQQQFIQFISDNDIRTIDERIKALPFVRDDELPEWEEWWMRTMGKYVYNHR